MVNLTIDDIKVSAAEGTTLLDAARQAGIYIPHICAHPDLPPVKSAKPAEAVYRSAVRIENKRPDLQYEGCQLCVVNIEGQKDLLRACNTPVAEGMVVRTGTPEAKNYRQDRLSLILAKHPHACLTCAQREGCARFPCSMHIPEKERCCVLFGNCELQKA
ncbi:MAG TPA: 2Fe-2S iron-sulfur cluster-binding protein, partial [Sedimentisphaerales bacterium]|nr:2Fe-2S iron-sulfur cluster-binding protein [Sedimentisphaerales bacterium]